MADHQPSTPQSSTLFQPAPTESNPIRPNPTQSGARWNACLPNLVRAAGEQFGRAQRQARPSNPTWNLELDRPDPAESDQIRLESAINVGPLNIVDSSLSGSKFRVQASRFQAQMRQVIASQDVASICSISGLGNSGWRTRCPAILGASKLLPDNGLSAILPLVMGRLGVLPGPSKPGRRRP